MARAMEQFVTTFSASGLAPKETCRQCRFRKVRCDGRHGDKGCGDCARLSFDCSFVAALHVPPSSPSSPPSAEPARVVERRRTSRACAHCRQQKVRCSGGAPCLACKKKGAACVYATDRRKGSRAASSSAAATPTEALFPGHADLEPASADETPAASPTATTPGTTHASVEPGTAEQRPRTGPASLLPPDMQALVEFYFGSVYPLPSYAFLHPPTTIRQCRDGELDPSLCYALSAVASHHRGPSQAPADVELGWIQAAEDLVWRHLESPTISRLQALLLAVMYRVETGALQRAFMLSSLAARAAAAMRLNHERPSAQDGAARVSHEVRRRIVWSLKLVERYFSVGLAEFELCPVDSIYLDLPCWELEFSSSTCSSSDDGLAGAGRSLVSCDYGSYHLCVRLEMLRRDLMKLTRSLAVCDAPFPQLPSVMHGFEQHLAAVGRELPDGPALTTDTISQLLNTPWLPRRILVYLSFHQCQCDLYRLLLRNYREAAPAAVLDAVDPALVLRAEQLCLQHATAVVDVLSTLNQQSHRAPPLEFDTAICGYHATRILLFVSQCGRVPARPSQEWALSRAELCVASLKRFFSASKLVKPVLEDMRRAIAVLSSRSAAAASLAPGPSAAAAARVRQRLAIHSLLRQADFADDEEGSEDSRGGARSPRETLLSPSVPASSSSSSSSQPVAFPALLPESDPWQPQWLAMSGAADGWNCEPQQAPIAAGSAPSFDFPWLQRWDG